MKANSLFIILIFLLRYSITYADQYVPVGKVPVRFSVNGPMLINKADQKHFTNIELKGEIPFISIGFLSDSIKIDFLPNKKQNRRILIDGKSDKPAYKNDTSLIYFKVFNSSGKDITKETGSQPAIARYDNTNLTARDEEVFIRAGLNTEDWILINFYDNATDSLQSVYVMQRVSAIIELEGYYLYNTKEVNYISNIQGKSAFSDGLVKLASSERSMEISTNHLLQLIFKKPENLLGDLLFSYALINRKDTVYKVEEGKKQIILPVLKSDTHYTLAVWSTFQPDNRYIKLYQIYVRPLWYQTNTFYILLSITLLLLTGTITYLLMRKRIHQADNKQSETEQKILSVQSQLNPHFIFNALSSIQGLNNTNQTAEVNHYIAEFSNLLRNTLKSSENITHTLDKELTILESYLSLEQLRFGFRHRIDIDSRISTSVISIPTLLLQPLVENAIKHGISGNGNKGLIHLHFAIEGNDIVITINDNGKGFSNSLTEGYGIRLTRKRIDLFNKISKEKKISLNFGHHNGARVTIILHNYYNQ